RGYAVRAHAVADAIPTDRDSAEVHRRWRARLGDPAPIDALVPEVGASALVIDGLFGIGLARPVEGAAAQVLLRLEQAGWPVLAVDVPSVIDPDTGAIVGGSSAVASRAIATVTMIADKPGLHTGAGISHARWVVLAAAGVHPRRADRR